MLEVMRMGQLARQSQSAQIRAVNRFAEILGKSSHTTTIEDLRRLQVDMFDAVAIVDWDSI